MQLQQLNQMQQQQMQLHMQQQQMQQQQMPMPQQQQATFGSSAQQQNNAMQSMLQGQQRMQSQPALHYAGIPCGGGASTWASAQQWHQDENSGGWSSNGNTNENGRWG